MKIDILTLFPEMFVGPFSESILKRAQTKGLITIYVHNLRDWAIDKHRMVDDSPYGGGPGMVLKVDVIDRALFDLKSKVKSQKLKVKVTSQKLSRPWVILLTPQGKSFTQQLAQTLAKKDHLILIAGHYEGFDERVRSLVDEEISIGDYVLTGGELPAMVVADAVTRLLPGVLGKDISSDEESFSLVEHSPNKLTKFKTHGAPLLEYPHYTRPESYRPTSRPKLGTLSVPELLKSGHHAEITKWRQAEALKRTQHRRPDLLKREE